MFSMPQPLLHTDDIDVIKDQFEAWMEGAKARAQGIELYECPYSGRSRKADAWENGWEQIDHNLQENT